jgi:cytochrome P450 family 6
MFAYFISDLLHMFTGMRFALMQVKTGLCHMLSNFEVEPCKNKPLRIVFDTKSFMLTSKEEIPLSFKRAKQ